jgi:hypothetical protein
VPPYVNEKMQLLLPPIPSPTLVCVMSPTPHLRAPRVVIALLLPPPFVSDV